MGDAIDLSGDGGVLKQIVRRAKPDVIAPSDDFPVVDEVAEGLTHCYCEPKIVASKRNLANSARKVVRWSRQVMFPSSLVHQVPEGHVGAYWRGGALLNIITEPGFHLKFPFVTDYEPVQVTFQTDQVKDIPCGTKGGVMITFEKIEVVNRLRKDYVYDTLLNYGVNYDNTWIYGKIHHEINRQSLSTHPSQEYAPVYAILHSDEAKKLFKRDKN